MDQWSRVRIVNKFIFFQVLQLYYHNGVVPDLRKFIVPILKPLIFWKKYVKTESQKHFCSVFRHVILGCAVFIEDKEGCGKGEHQGKSERRN